MVRTSLYSSVDSTVTRLNCKGAQTQTARGEGHRLSSTMDAFMVCTGAPVLAEAKCSDAKTERIAQMMERREAWRHGLHLFLLLAPGMGIKWLADEKLRLSSIQLEA